MCGNRAAAGATAAAVAANRIFRTETYWQTLVSGHSKGSAGAAAAATASATTRVPRYDQMYCHPAAKPSSDFFSEADVQVEVGYLPSNLYGLVLYFMHSGHQRSCGLLLLLLKVSSKRQALKL